MFNDDFAAARRKFLKLITSVTGFIGAIGISIPFSKYFLPSAKAMSMGGPLEVDLSGIKPGQLKVIAWRGKPILILRRTPQMLDDLTGLEDRLIDPYSQESKQPRFAQNEYRSLKPEFVILEGVCTHAGCIPILKPEHGASEYADSWWRGGFFCPCHGSIYDLSGRIYKGKPAPENLQVPAYRYVSDNRIILGETSKNT